MNTLNVNTLCLYGKVQEVIKTVVEEKDLIITTIIVKWQANEYEKITAVDFYKNLPFEVMTGDSIKIRAGVQSKKYTNGWFTKVVGYQIDRTDETEKKPY